MRVFKIDYKQYEQKKEKKKNQQPIKKNENVEC